MVMQHKGETEAQRRFALVYDTHYKSVLAYARRRSFSCTDADEIVSETFLTAWRRLDVIPSGDEALAWLFAVARRVIANHRRANRRRTDLGTRLAQEVEVGAVEIDARLMATDEQRSVLEALARLKPEDQELLRLVTWEDLSHRHVAQVLGCSEGAVAVRLHRARARFGKELVKGKPSSGHNSSRRAAAWTREGGLQ